MGVLLDYVYLRRWSLKVKLGTLVQLGFENTTIHILDQNEKHTHSYVRLWFEINIHISILQFIMLNYNRIIEEFVLTIMKLHVLAEI